MNNETVVEPSEHASHAGFEGSEVTNVAAAFRKLRRRVGAGVLVAESATTVRRIFFDSGAIISARSTLADERLGEVMLRAGRITKQHFEDASIFVSHGRKLGESLVELAVIANDEVEVFLRAQTFDIVCAAINEPVQRLSFEVSTESRAVLSSTLSVVELIMEAARRAPSVADFVREMHTSPMGYRRAERDSRESEIVGLTPEEGYLLSRFEGTTPLKDVLAMSPLPRERAARALLGLVECGIVVPGSGALTPMPVEPAETIESQLSRELNRLYPRLQKEDPWDVLGLTRDTNNETALRAFRGAVQRYHPDRHASIEDPELKSKLASVYRSFAEPYHELSLSQKTPVDSKAEALDATSPKLRPEKTTEPPLALPPPDAEPYYLAAKTAYQAEDYWRATELLRRAVELEEDRAEFHYLLGLTLGKNPNWQHQSQESLERAIDLDAWKPQYLEALGELYDRAGMTQRAERMRVHASAIR